MKKLLVVGLTSLALAGAAGFAAAQPCGCAPVPPCQQMNAAGPCGGWGMQGKGMGRWGGGMGWQQPGPGGQFALGGLNLSDDQVKKIDAIRDKQRTDTHAKIRDVLNAEQKKQFDERAKLAQERQKQRDEWRKQWQQNCPMAQQQQPRGQNRR
jgi:Spy/CpxP family protein refolding chaperone